MGKGILLEQKEFDLTVKDLTGERNLPHSLKEGK